MAAEQYAFNRDFSAFRDPRSGDSLRRDGDDLIAADGARYPIINHIPRFVPAGGYADDFGAQWNRFPRTQLDSHSGLPI